MSSRLLNSFFIVFCALVAVAALVQLAQVISH